METRTELLTRIAEPLAASLGLSLWGVEFVGAARPVVRVYVDVLTATAGMQTAPAQEPAPRLERETAHLPAGVSVDQCAELSRLLGLALDVEELFAGGWVLEVSSPGLERPFFSPAQLQSYTGREIEAVLGQPHALWPGRKHFRGILVSAGDGIFTLRLPLSARKIEEPEEVTIDWDKVRKVHLVQAFVAPANGKRNKNGAPKKDAGHAENAGDVSGGIA